MIVEFKYCKVDSEIIEIMGKFTMRIDELKRDIENDRGRSFDSLKDGIKKSIAEKISLEYLKKNKMDLINEIDLKEIIDAIKLKVIEGFSLNR